MLLSIGLIILSLAVMWNDYTTRKSIDILFTRSDSHLRLLENEIYVRTAQVKELKQKCHKLREEIKRINNNQKRV